MEQAGALDDWAGVPRSRPLSSAQLRGLPLTPVDGFILSRIDGGTSLRDIATVTGLDEPTIVECLRKLTALGVVEWNEPVPSFVRGAASAPEPPPVAPATPSQATQPQIRISSPAPPGPPESVPPYDPAELDEDVELERDDRKRILDRYYRLERLDHYRILGVSPAAEKKAIKRAYYELAALFHPDKFFRKRLGSYKMKMEVIFGRITQAHDTLTSKERRREYDEYLQDQLQARGMEQLLEQAVAQAQLEDQELRERVTSTHPTSPPPARSSIPPPTGSVPPPRHPLSMPPGSGSIPPVTLPSGVSGSSTPPPRPSAPPPSEAETRARRDVLARRLLGNRAPPPSAPGIPASAPAPSSGTVPVSPRVDAGETLRRHYEMRMLEARKVQARKHVTDGEKARAAGDHVAAAAAFRMALSFTPQDAALQQLLDETSQQADAILGDSYRRQAQYEEKAERWGEAAKSWLRVTRAKTHDAEAHQRAAHAVVKAGGNLHDAASAGQRAVALDPKNASFRVTLANVYMAAGLTLNARRELEAAAQLAPNDDNIASMLKRLGKAS